MQTVPPADVLRLLDDPPMQTHGPSEATVPVFAVDVVVEVEVRVKGVPQTPGGKRGAVGAPRKLSAEGIATVPDAVPAVNEILRVANFWGAVNSKQSRLNNPVTGAPALRLVEPGN